MAIHNTGSTLPVHGAVQAAAPATYFSAGSLSGSDYSSRQPDIAYPQTAAMREFFSDPGIIPNYDCHPSAPYQYNGSQPAPAGGYWQPQPPRIPEGCAEPLPPQPQLPRIPEEYVYPSQLPPSPGGCAEPLLPQPPYLQVPGRQSQGSPSHLSVEPQDNPSTEYPNLLQPQTPASQSTNGKPPRKKHRFLCLAEEKQLIEEIKRQQQQQPVGKRSRRGANQELADKYGISKSAITRLRQLVRTEELKLPLDTTEHSELPHPQIPAGQSAGCGIKPCKGRKHLSPAEEQQLIEEIQQQPPRACKGDNKRLMKTFKICQSTMTRYRRMYRRQR